MEKRVILTLTAIILLALAIGLNITGFASLGDPDNPTVNVTRLVTKDQTENITIIRLGVISSENVVAIKETFIPADCVILDTYSEPEIDIFEVNEAEQTWIIANRSDTLNIDMYYFLTYECGINETAGEAFILTDDDQLSSGTFDQGDDTPTTPGTPGSGPSGSRGSSGGTTTPQTTSTAGLQSQPIQQTETQEEFNEIVKQATKNILGLDASKQVDTNSLIIWLALGLLILIILIVLIYSLFKKTDDFPKKPSQQKPLNATQKPAQKLQ